MSDLSQRLSLLFADYPICLRAADRIEQLEALVRQCESALEKSVSTCFDRFAHNQVLGDPEHFVNQALTAIKEAGL